MSEQKGETFDNVRNWHEDMGEPSGNYEIRCTGCGSSFIGHVWRTRCRICDTAGRHVIGSELISDGTIPSINVRNHGVVGDFQDRVHEWALKCFGEDITFDKIERNHRFLEEALELVQSLGCTRDEVIKLVDYVYGRPEGEVPQEVGGVMVTLATLCSANAVDMRKAGDIELRRIWTKIDKIREKQRNKPDHSPLPQ